MTHCNSWVWHLAHLFPITRSVLREEGEKRSLREKCPLGKGLSGLERIRWEFEGVNIQVPQFSLMYLILKFQNAIKKVKAHVLVVQRCHRTWEPKCTKEMQLSAWGDASQTGCDLPTRMVWSYGRNPVEKLELPSPLTGTDMSRVHPIYPCQHGKSYMYGMWPQRENRSSRSPLDNSEF